LLASSEDKQIADCDSRRMGYMHLCLGGGEKRMNGKTLVRLVLVGWFGLASSFAGSAAPTLANGNNILAPSHNFTLQGDVISKGVGLRGAGTGDVVITGIPAGATVYRAFLYWGTLGSVNTYTSPTLSGLPVEGDLIGTSGDTCWGVQNNFVYRADVTSLVNGNGTYTIAGLPQDLELGNDSQGASLVVLYSDASLPLRTIIINDGAVSLNFSILSYTDTIDGFDPDSPVTNAKVTYLVGDGQAMWDAGNVSFNGEAIAAGVFTGVEGDYWGTHTFDVTSLVSSAPATTTINDNDPDNPDSPDCLLWAATIFSVTAAQSEESMNQLFPSTNISIFGDVVADGVGLRGTGEGEILVSGIPGNAFVQHAYLYWATIGNSSRFTSPTLDGQEVNGGLIGISGDTCWGALHNYVYRADVTDRVQGNGSYTIAGLPDNLAAGNDSQGASLVIVYNAPGLYRTILINDGAVTLDFENHSYTDTITGFTADQPQAQARVTYLVGDGQSRWDTGNVSIEGTPIANNVFNGVDGNYWGTVTFDVTGLVSEPSSTTTINNNDPDNPTSPDCLLWAATIFSVQTEQPVVDIDFYLPLVFR
jgi:hypothetical protein